MFSVHMAQHMLLSMVAPPLLALGAPITLALRYLPATRRPPGARGGAGLAAGGPAQPAVPAAVQPDLRRSRLFVSSTFGLYFSGLFADLMASHAGHLAMSVHFLLIGCLLFWPLVSPDPLPHRPGHGARMLLLVILVPFHAFFGLAIITDTHVLAASWYERARTHLGCQPAVGPAHRRRHRDGAGRAGRVPRRRRDPHAVVARGCPRSAGAFDRKSDRDPEHDELAAYNRYLADLAERG